MRFSVFVALLVATLVACYSSLAIAENSPAFPNKDNNGRRLQAQKVTEAATHAISGQADDQLLKYALKLSNAAKGDEAAIKKASDLAALAKATAKATDDEVAAVTKLVKEARGDEAHTMRYILGFAQKEGKKVSDESAALVSTKIAETVTKNPKSWPRLRKFAKVTLGAAAGGLAIYGAYKLLFDKNSQTGTATTTTTGSG
ncbi:hypothetical protein F441_13575 [Phytophthora nicotianae CJ01A1]|uniref:RxLR effector protein n=1 Tax=Phytophthora nicotianae CJ01A1 TaxID=1317063 RepID=W2WK49_PHYNI|nr:hypothetical protein F441_13575 [Phytophthora nicotianae CJ01A1]